MAKNAGQVRNHSRHNNHHAVSSLGTSNAIQTKAFEKQRRMLGAMGIKLPKNGGQN